MSDWKKNIMANGLSVDSALSAIHDASTQETRKDFLVLVGSHAILSSDEILWDEYLSLGKRYHVPVLGGEHIVAMSPQNRTTEQPVEEELSEADKGVLSQLQSVFYNGADAMDFYLKIRFMSTNSITELVNKWVKERKISDLGNSRKGVLWKILHDAGLYTKSKQNWCRRVY